MKTILHTIDTTGPGGAETVFIELATRLPKNKYKSIVVIRGKGWVHDELVRRGIEPILIDAKGSFHFAYLWQLRQLIREQRIDLIQSHLLGTNLYCSLAGILTNTPVVATFHGTVDIGDDERFKHAKFSIINRGSSNIIAVSESLKSDMLERTTVNQKKIRIIYNGIEINNYQRPKSRSLRERFGWSDSAVVVGSLGNIRPAKGYEDLLDVAAHTAHSGVDCRFVIAGQGTGPLYEKLLEKRKQLELEDRVIFLGFIDDAAEFLSNLDIFLSTSISEGLPLSAIQAMVARLPIIATKCGGWEELITDQQNGLLFEVGDSKRIGQAILDLAGDSALKSTLSTHAERHAINHFGMDAMLTAYQSLYDRLTD